MEQAQGIAWQGTVDQGDVLGHKVGAGDRSMRRSRTPRDRGRSWCGDVMAQVHPSAVDFGGESSLRCSVAPGAIDFCVCAPVLNSVAGPALIGPM